MKLVTDRLRLRPWEESDAARLYELAKDPAVGPAAGWPAHKSVEESLQVIQENLQVPETYAVLRKDDNLLIGCADLRFGEDACSEKDDEPELGYAPEAATCLINHAFADLNCKAVWCCYYEGNDKSKRVQEKLGFSYVKTDPEGDTLLGYKLPEVENVLKRESWLK